VGVARILIEHRADVTAQDNNGWSPLYQAIIRGDVEHTWLLVDHGADMAVQDVGGQTPLHLASDGGIWN
jgi:ankyrin repeat protein